MCAYACASACACVANAVIHSFVHSEFRFNCTLFAATTHLPRILLLCHARRMVISAGTGHVSLAHLTVHTWWEFSLKSSMMLSRTASAAGPVSPRLILANRPPKDDDGADFFFDDGVVPPTTFSSMYAPGPGVL